MSNIIGQPLKTWVSVLKNDNKSKIEVFIPLIKPKTNVTLPTAIININSFFDTCHETQIHYIYFTCIKNKCIPNLKSKFREWFIYNKPVYSIVKQDDGWSYTYGISSLKKLVYIDNSEIISFEKHPIGAPIDKISKFIIPQKIQKELTITIGDHITIGIENSIDPYDLLIETHKTYYLQRKTYNIQYKRESIHCDFLLYKQPIDSKIKCNRKIFNMGEQYKNEQNAIPIIQKITNVYKGTMVGGSNTPHKLKNKKHIYKGIQYQIQKGTRNGKYIQVGNTRRYIGGSLRLTYNGIGFDDGFINFLHKYILSIVAEQQSGMEDITIIYDEESYIRQDSNKYICIIYNYTVKEEEERASIYYIDALKAFTAYYTYITPEVATTYYEKTCLQEFHEEILLHIPQVVLV